MDCDHPEWFYCGQTTVLTKNGWMLVREYYCTSCRRAMTRKYQMFVEQDYLEVVSDNIYVH